VSRGKGAYMPASTRAICLMSSSLKVFIRSFIQSLFVRVPLRKSSKVLAR
jgi:hypothetical protein